MKRCKHVRAVLSGADRTFQCLACWAIGIRSLGPSNDEPLEVQCEMRDAELIAAFGGMEHGVDVWDENGVSIIFDDRRDDWSWDPSRPIAEQLAETARDDVDAATAWRDWAKDNMISHEEYEASRDAEPDCRDEDDPTDPGKLAHAMAADGHDAETIREHTGLIEVDLGIADLLAVCSCSGDALLSDRCRDFDPMTCAVIPGDFNGPHGGVA